MIKQGVAAVFALGILLGFVAIALLVSDLPSRYHERTRVLETMDSQQAHQFQKDCLQDGGTITLTERSQFIIIRCRVPVEGGTP